MVSQRVAILQFLGSPHPLTFGLCPLCEVYTITNKKLKDPTACRLEHFWWHVWGSDRRKLSGEKLARLFEDISTGPTFVPLRSVANRWEGPDVGGLSFALSSTARY